MYKFLDRQKKSFDDLCLVLLDYHLNYLKNYYCDIFTKILNNNTIETERWKNIPIIEEGGDSYET